MAFNKVFGNLGEILAIKKLKDEGYKILAENYTYGKGEIDIIAEKDDVVVFIEVKYRNSLNYGSPIDSYTRSKAKQIRKIAEAFLYQKEITNKEIRFDFVGIVPAGDNTKFEVEHIKNVMDY